MKNNLYIITGGSSGFGKALVENLLEKNQTVISVSKSVIPVKQIEMYKKKLFQVKIDFSKIFQKKIKKELISIFKKIDFKKIDQIILVNNAAIIQPIDKIINLKEKDIQEHIQINFNAPVVMTQAFLSLLKKYKKEKLIIQITSGAATSPVQGWSMYCSGKAALNMFNEGLAKQYATDKNMRCIGYSPGIMDTNMQKKIRSVSKSQFPKIEEFKKYKLNKQLKSTDYVAKDLLKLIMNFKDLKPGSVYRVN